MSDAAALPLAEPARRQPLMRLASDSRLVRLAAAGSTPAFSAIYERHHQAVYRYCRSILTSDEDARDALQNTMLKAMRALEGETREISLRPWLFRIAHNEAVSLVRRRRPDTSLSLAEELPAAGTDFTARQRLRDLIADLEQLTERQKSALVMRELSGLEFEEIAAALETSPEAAKQSVYEARVALQQLEQGRDMDCVDARKKLSAEDGRLLRGRHMRAHLKSCSDCRAFKEAISSRRGQLAMIAPPLPMGVAMHLLDGIIGGGGTGGGGAAAGGGAIGAAGATGSGATGFGMAGFGAGALAKVGLAGALALGTGAAVAEVGSGDPAAPWERAVAAAVASETDTLAKDENEPGTTGVERQAGPGPDGRPQAGGGPGAGPAAGGGGSQAAAPQAEGFDQASGSGAAPGPPGSVSDQAPSPSAAPVAGEGGPPESTGPAGVPPGQGGTPPGQGGTPPGLDGTPPGQGVTPPGQSVTPPGLDGTPGQGVIPPGQDATPPGQGATPPGQGGIAPGQGGASPPGLGL
jgi:RNA polymerase sigma factor (sigma-70 family)